MGGVYIRGMKMPTNCFLCPLSVLNENRLFCTVTKNEVLRAKIDAECPLAPVPPHGRLIDADAFRAEMDKHYPFDKLSQSKHREADAAKGTILVMLTDAPTIIPAEEAKE